MFIVEHPGATQGLNCGKLVGELFWLLGVRSKFRCQSYHNGV